MAPRINPNARNAIETARRALEGADFGGAGPAVRKAHGAALAAVNQLSAALTEDAKGTEDRGPYSEWERARQRERMEQFKADWKRTHRGPFRNLDEVRTTPGTDNAPLVPGGGRSGG